MIAVSNQEQALNELEQFFAGESIQIETGLANVRRTILTVPRICDLRNTEELLLLSGPL
jgi:hypothetical protein